MQESSKRAETVAKLKKLLRNHYGQMPDLEKALDSISDQELRSMYDTLVNEAIPNKEHADTELNNNEKTALNTFKTTLEQASTQKQLGPKFEDVNSKINLSIFKTALTEMVSTTNLVIYFKDCAPSNLAEVDVGKILQSISSKELKRIFNNISEINDPTENAIAWQDLNEIHLKGTALKELKPLLDNTTLTAAKKLPGKTLTQIANKYRETKDSKAATEAVHTALKKSEIKPGQVKNALKEIHAYLRSNLSPQNYTVLLNKILQLPDKLLITIMQENQHHGIHKVTSAINETFEQRKSELPADFKNTLLSLATEKGEADIAKAIKEFSDDDLYMIWGALPPKEADDHTERAWTRTERLLIKKTLLNDLKKDFSDKSPAELDQLDILRISALEAIKKIVSEAGPEQAWQEVENRFPSKTQVETMGDKLMSMVSKVWTDNPLEQPGLAADKVWQGILDNPAELNQTIQDYPEAVLIYSYSALRDSTSDQKDVWKRLNKANNARQIPLDETLMRFAQNVVSYANISDIMHDNRGNLDAVLDKIKEVAEAKLKSIAKDVVGLEAIKADVLGVTELEATDENIIAAIKDDNMLGVKTLASKLPSISNAVITAALKQRDPQAMQILIDHGAQITQKMVDNAEKYAKKHKRNKKAKSFHEFLQKAMSAETKPAPEQKTEAKAATKVTVSQLHDFVVNRQLDQVQEAYEANQGFDDIDAQEYSRIVKSAVTDNNIDMVKVLLDKRALESDTLNQLADMAKKMGGRDAMVKALRSKALNIPGPEQIMQKDAQGQIALHRASQQSNMDYFEGVLEATTDVNATDNEGNTALHIAVQKGNVAMVDALLKRGANILIRNTQQQSVFGLSKDAGMNLSLAHALSSQFENNLNEKNEQGQTLLHQACEFGDTQLFNALMKLGPDLTITDANGNTALHLAVQSGNINIVKTLMATKPNLNLQNNNGNTALHTAVLKSNTQVVDELLKAKPNLNIQNAQGNTPLHMAVVSEDLDMLKKILKAKPNLNIPNHENNTALHFAILTGQQDVLDTLLKSKPDINAVNENGNTALHMVLQQQDEASAKTLLKHGASVLLKNNDNKTAFDLAKNNETLFALVQEVLIKEVSTMESVPKDVLALFQEAYTNKLKTESTQTKNTLRKEALAKMDTMSDQHLDLLQVKLKALFTEEELATELRKVFKEGEQIIKKVSESDTGIPDKEMLQMIEKYERKLKLLSACCPSGSPSVPTQLGRKAHEALNRIGRKKTLERADKASLWVIKSQLAVLDRMMKGSKEFMGLLNEFKHRRDETGENIKLVQFKKELTQQLKKIQNRQKGRRSLAQVAGGVSEVDRKAKADAIADVIKDVGEALNPETLKDAVEKFFNNDTIAKHSQKAYRGQFFKSPRSSSTTDRRAASTRSVQMMLDFLDKHAEQAKELGIETNAEQYLKPPQSPAPGMHH